MKQQNKANDAQKEPTVRHYARRQRVGPGARALQVQDTKNTAPPLLHVCACTNRTRVRTSTTRAPCWYRDQDTEGWRRPFKPTAQYYARRQRVGPGARPLRVVRMTESPTTKSRVSIEFQSKQTVDGIEIPIERNTRREREQGIGCSHGSFARTFYSECISEIIAKLSQKCHFLPSNYSIISN